MTQPESHYIFDGRLKQKSISVCLRWGRLRGEGSGRAICCEPVVIRCKLHIYWWRRPLRVTVVCNFTNSRFQIIFDAGVFFARLVTQKEDRSLKHCLSFCHFFHYQTSAEEICVDNTGSRCNKMRQKVAPLRWMWGCSTILILILILIICTLFLLPFVYIEWHETNYNPDSKTVEMLFKTLRKTERNNFFLSIP